MNERGKILIIDDSWVVLESVRGALVAAGYTVRVTTEAEAAVKMTSWAELVVVDFHMPSVDGATVWFCSDEHLTFAPDDGGAAPRLGDRLRVWPAHIDPTMAKHEQVNIVDGDGEVVDVWPVDLRGW